VANLFDRYWRVTVGDKQIDALRVEFKVTRTLSATPNPLELTISNLSADTRAKLQPKGAVVELVAGYKGTAELIFRGDVRTIDHLRRGSEWATKILSGDGERAWNSARINESLAPGAKMSDAIMRSVSAFGINAGNAVREVAAGGFRGGLDQFSSGVVLHGPVKDVLGGLLESAGLDWSIQDMQLQLLRPGAVTEEQAILLSPETGLIESPETGAPDQKGNTTGITKMRSLLQPGMRPGRQIRLQSFSKSGFYRCEKVVHVGDSHAITPWYSEIEARPL
jgi:hypothetical protein